MMKKAFMIVAAALFATAGMAQSRVFMIRDISPENLVKIYHALGVKADGRVAVKISTGEGGNKHYLKPELIGQLVDEVNGTIVECCTAYGGTRQDPKKHWQTIEEHGFAQRFAVDLMDEFGEIRIPVQDRKHLKYDIVGEHLANYDFMINLAHFKGHAMGGFGGVLKNASIGVASTGGKAYIHSVGVTDDPVECWKHTNDQDGFLESMAAAAQAVHNYFRPGRIIYIDVMNNLSVDCDCDGSPDEPQLKDMGILASNDPVALDKACTDLVFNHKATEGDDEKPLIERINRQHGLHILEYAESIGLGSTKYKLIELK
ncbi:MAG: DUF362 domain-containing protein [Alloprevotella sp.]|nr:DUF362 domain-containing protein [Alloprevotella sp.]